MLERLAAAILTLAKSTGSLISVTIFSCFGMNILASDQYLAIIVPGRMYRTAFLKRNLHPKNLSEDFRIHETFGIDYEHQAICTDEVPRKMRKALLERLTAQIGSDNIRKVKVEFKSAGASSLDYAALCDFAGAVAALAALAREGRHCD